MTVAVLINQRARKGTRLEKLVRRSLPAAEIVSTSTIEECRAWVGGFRKKPPSLIISGGGDGTTTALINELIDAGGPLPPIAILPLGTGNAWAHVAGAPPPKEGLPKLAELGAAPPPLRAFGLVKINDRRAPFAGTGFDAELVSDYKTRLGRWPQGPLRDAHEGLRGYLGAVFTRTLPRHLFGEGVASVRVVNLGGPAQTVNAGGEAVPLEGGETGAVLYEGKAGVAGAATIPEWGYRFRAFPFAELVPGRLSARVYAGSALRATTNMFRLWRGQHPMPLMHDFIVDKVRMEFDREVPLQFAGDLVGSFSTLTFERAPEEVRIVDWNALLLGKPASGSQRVAHTA